MNMAGNTTDTEEETVTVRCTNTVGDEECGWEWDTKSQAHRVTCPSCQYKVKNPRYLEDEESDANGDE